MTLFSTLARQLCLAIGLTIVSAIYFPAIAAELEGTPVQVDASSPVEVQLKVEVPVAPPPPDVIAPEIAPPPSNSDEHQHWTHEHEAQVREAEAQAREVERQVRDQQQNWQRDLEKNLSQAFGGNKDNKEDDGDSVMDALMVMFIVFAGITFLCSPLILVGFYLVLRYKARVRRQQVLNSNIDKLLAAGRDIPVEILRGDEPRGANEHGNLAKGIRNICLGTGLLIFLTVLVGFDIGAVGFILIAIGCSQTLVWYLNKPTTGSHPEQQAGQQD
ncbi:MAG: hypothetical protein B0W54_10190 [Cellvibrio sp. 79]|nr:MAG: hypothetical protein B0W54_10190 [Cellvibrio sp. 79]